MASFANNLEDGLVGESLIANWIKRRGWHVLPVYETEQEYKGPRVFSSKGELVAPDMFCFKQDGCRWVEAKHKSAFTWSRRFKAWQTGIDLHHFKHYLQVREQSAMPLALLFLHKPGNVAKDSPESCPSGLFGGEIKKLYGLINHTHKNWGRHGMVYWNHGSLTQYASFEEVMLSSLSNEEWLRDYNS